MLFSELSSSVKAWFINTEIPVQLSLGSYRELYVNPYFYVPVILFVLLQFYRRTFKVPILVGVAIGVGFFLDSPVCQGLIINGEIQLGKVLPVVSLAFIALLISVYTVLRVD